MKTQGLTHQQLEHYGSNLSAFSRVVMAIAGLCLLLFLAAPAHAQTTPEVTFGASVTNANGSLTTRLTWSTTPAATSCTASGHPSWTGTKPASGSADLPAITLSGTYGLTLSCTWPGDTQARLTWAAPTQNTDGSALAACPAGTTTGPCLAGYRVKHGTSATSLTDIQPVNSPSTLTYLFTALPVGMHYFAVSAVNASGVESENSAVASKAITSAVTRQSAVTLTVNPKPGNPGGLTVE